MKQEERVFQSFSVDKVAWALIVILSEAPAKMIRGARCKLAHPGIAFLEVLLPLHLADKRPEPLRNLATGIIRGLGREKEVLEDKSYKAFS